MIIILRVHNKSDGNRAEGREGHLVAAEQEVLQSALSAIDQANLRLRNVLRRHESYEDDEEHNSEHLHLQYCEKNANDHDTPKIVGPLRRNRGSNKPPQRQLPHRPALSHTDVRRLVLFSDSPFVIH